MAARADRGERAASKKTRFVKTAFGFGADANGTKAASRVVESASSKAGRSRVAASVRRGPSGGVGRSAKVDRRASKRSARLDPDLACERRVRDKVVFKAAQDDCVTSKGCRERTSVSSGVGRKRAQSALPRLALLSMTVVRV
jgi:hypothetical protein